jgi:hypothetical protein
VVLTASLLATDISLSLQKYGTIPSFWVLIQGHPAASFRRFYNCRYKSVIRRLLATKIMKIKISFR